MTAELDEDFAKILAASEDFMGTLAAVYDQVFAEQPQASRARGTAEKVFVITLACRSDFARAHATFEAVELQMRSLPPAVDRGHVLRVLCAAAIVAEHLDALKPAWLDDRDDAWTQASLGLKRLTAVLRQRHLDHQAEEAVRAVERLKHSGGARAELDELRPASGGRRTDAWRRQVLERLCDKRDLHLTRDDARQLLAAAGLSAKSPTEPQ